LLLFQFAKPVVVSWLQMLLRRNPCHLLPTPLLMDTRFDLLMFKQFLLNFVSLVMWRLVQSLQLHSLKELQFAL
jgi:hypothetical protein